MIKAFESTNLPFLREDCKQEFADPMRTRVYGGAEELYHKLVARTGNKGNPTITEHLCGRLFPAIAYYGALLVESIPQGDALATVRRETQRAALIKKESSTQMAHIPLAFLLYCTSVKSHVSKNFPTEGRETEWVSSSGEEIHFNLYRCLYWDSCRQHGCPELCTVYCKNDTTVFSGLLPRIRSERSEALREGAACCDFHFLSGRYVARD